MKPKARISIGFLLGCVLSVLALLLAGVGHGTYAPMAFNSSVLMFLPSIGIVVALFAAPLLWAAYYGLIPALRQPRIRVATSSAVVVLHTVPGAWLACTDPAFQGAFELMRLYLLTYIVIAFVAVVGLIVLSRGDGESHDHVA